MTETTYALFRGKESSSAVCAKLLSEIGTLGEYGVEEKKTCLHVVANGRAFLGVHPRKRGLCLTIVLSHSLEGPRIKKAERASANRWHIEVDVKTPEEVDAQLIAWIAEAYARP